MVKSETIAVRVSPETKAALEQAAAAADRSISSYAEMVLRSSADEEIDQSADRRRRQIKISDGEKLILFMLRDLYRQTKMKSTEIDADFVVDAISHGYHWALDWKYSGVFTADEDHDRTLTEVGDILEMWDWIERAVKGMSPQSRERLQAVDGLPSAKFIGFDGNNEANHLGIAYFLTRRLERFVRFKDRELNSHMPTIKGYRRMLRAFKPMLSAYPGMDITLSSDQVLVLLKSWRST